MKLNSKVYNQLTGEPFDTQVIDGKIVEFHYMNETPFLFQYASKGRFAIWTSDGKNYRVLIEKKYYGYLEDFYQPEVNAIWLGFLEKVSGISKKVNMWFIIPTLVLYAIVAFIATVFFPDQMLSILLGLIVLVVISNMIQGRVVNKRVRDENLGAQNKIREFLGNDQFDQLIKSQEVHYQEYFKFEEEVSPETAEPGAEITEETNNVETSNEEEDKSE
jgi:hypothetical protein